MCGQVTAHLPADPISAHHARRLLGDVCGRWALGEDLRDDLALPLAELVANAAVHARTPIQLIVSLADGTFEVAVRDQSGRPPIQRPLRTDQVGGRGLQIVAATTDEWGVVEFIGGKDVWFRVRLPAGWRPPKSCACGAGDRTTPSGLALSTHPPLTSEVWY